MILEMLFVPTAIAVTFLVKHSGQRHLYYLTPSQKEYASKLDWISQPFNIMSLATGKVSVALLILRLLGPSAFGDGPCFTLSVYFQLYSVS